MKINMIICAKMYIFSLILVEEAARMIKSVDQDGSGTVDFEEFLVMMGIPTKEENYKSIFKYIKRVTQNFYIHGPM